MAKAGFSREWRTSNQTSDHLLSFCIHLLSFSSTSYSAHFFSQSIVLINTFFLQLTSYSLLFRSTDCTLDRFAVKTHRAKDLHSNRLSLNFTLTKSFSNSPLRGFVTVRKIEALGKEGTLDRLHESSLTTELSQGAICLSWQTLRQRSILTRSSTVSLKVGILAFLNSILLAVHQAEVQPQSGAASLVCVASRGKRWLVLLLISSVALVVGNLEGFLLSKRLIVLNWCVLRCCDMLFHRFAFRSVFDRNVFLHVNVPHSTIMTRLKASDHGLILVLCLGIEYRLYHLFYRRFGIFYLVGYIDTPHIQYGETDRENRYNYKSMKSSISAQKHARFSSINPFYSNSRHR